MGCRYASWCVNGCGKSVKRTFCTYAPTIYEYKCERCGQLYVNTIPAGKEKVLRPISIKERNMIVDKKKNIFLVFTK